MLFDYAISAVPVLFAARNLSTSYKLFHSLDDDGINQALTNTKLIKIIFIKYPSPYIILLNQSENNANIFILWSENNPTNPLSEPLSIFIQRTAIQKISTKQILDNGNAAFLCAELILRYIQYGKLDDERIGAKIFFEHAWYMSWYMASQHILPVLLRSLVFPTIGASLGQQLSEGLIYLQGNFAKLLPVVVTRAIGNAYDGVQYVWGRRPFKVYWPEIELIKATRCMGYVAGIGYTVNLGIYALLKTLSLTIVGNVCVQLKQANVLKDYLSDPILLMQGVLLLSILLESTYYADTNLLLNGTAGFVIGWTMTRATQNRISTLTRENDVTEARSLAENLPLINFSGVFLGQKLSEFILIYLKSGADRQAMCDSLMSLAEQQNRRAIMTQEFQPQPLKVSCMPAKWSLWPSSKLSFQYEVNDAVYDCVAVVNSGMNRQAHASCKLN